MYSIISLYHTTHNNRFSAKWHDTLLLRCHYKILWSAHPKKVYLMKLDKDGLGHRGHHYPQRSGDFKDVPQSWVQVHGLCKHLRELQNRIFKLNKLWRRHTIFPDYMYCLIMSRIKLSIDVNRPIDRCKCF